MISIQQLSALALCLVSFSALGQTTNSTLLPYNPDFDSNGSIEASDLIGFLPFFGNSFVAQGVLPIQFGGTGVSTADSARVALTLSVFSDVIPAGAPNAAGLIAGDITISGTLSQGTGSTATGIDASSTGHNCTAPAAYSSAANQNCNATGLCSNAQGESTTAAATASHSEGMQSNASGIAAHAEGMQTVASADYSHAEGFQTDATNTSAHAEGHSTLASGLYSHSENRNTTATATCAHAEGEGTSATADAAHSEGYQSQANGFASHAQGYQSIATGLFSSASGRGSSATATTSSAIGFNLIADQNYSTVVGQHNLANRTGTLFVVGSGVDNLNPANAFEVSSTGAVVNGSLDVNGAILLNAVDLNTTITDLQATNILLQSQIDALQLLVTGLQTQINTWHP